MTNPFLVYVISFLSVLLVYLLGWSNLYPSLTIWTVLFFVLSFAISAFLGIRSHKKGELRYETIEYNKKIKYISVLIFLGYIAEFIYAGGAPLLNSKINYLEFSGIPTFHIFLFSFTIFYGVYLFHLFLSTKNKIVLVLYLLNYVPALLIVSRGLIINIFLGSLFVFLSMIGIRRLLNKKIIISLAVIGIAFLYLFGFFGNYRVSLSDHTYDKFSSKYILDIGGASESFRNNKIIPKPFFWSYIYISSPLANLQLNIDDNNTEINSTNIKNFVTREVLPDIVARRLVKEEPFQISDHVKLIKKELIVGTLYMGGFYYLGWIGVILQFIYLMAVIFIYMKLVGKNNKLRIVAISMMCNMVVLSTFSNMIVFAGMSMQLVFPILYRIILYIYNKRIGYEK
ncbi:O-antigen polymerase [Clostridium sp. C8-1-8]|uniref:O-antigen polymerase n=1 Tax=Clostridium sp. C8-1-8 TaxID=2698831 RepID=UPI00136B4536|nr:O-antigen polymerase [Clostridium sp. C8-1-8]